MTEEELQQLEMQTHAIGFGKLMRVRADHVQHLILEAREAQGAAVKAHQKFQQLSQVMASLDRDLSMFDLVNRLERAAWTVKEANKIISHYKPKSTIL